MPNEYKFSTDLVAQVGALRTALERVLPFVGRSTHLRDQQEAMAEAVSFALHVIEHCDKED